MKKPVWPQSSSKRVDRSLSAHTVMGLVISALLYIICLSGALAVFEDELGWWELPNTPSVASVSPEAAQRASENAIAEDGETTHLYLYLPRENWPRFVVATDNKTHSADAEGNLVGGYETAWNDFLIHLHYYLHLPESFGMIVVSVFGVFLVAMAISGFLAHPKVFKDAFRMKRQGQRRLVQADLHNRLSVWTAPFHIIVAATGAMIGLFLVVAYLLAQTSFDGNTRALSEAVFGTEPPVNEAPAPLADVSTAFENMDDVAPGRPPFLFVLHDPQTEGQHIGIYGEHTDRLIYGETYNFNADGEYTGKAGSSDGELGQQIAMSVYRAHFGDFGGHAMKIAYFVLGIVLCVIIASGMNIYFLKAAEKGKARPRLEAAWSGLVWGAAVMCGVTMLMALAGIASGALTYAFWIGTAGVSLLAAFKGQKGKAGIWLRGGLGVVLLACVLVHLVQHSGTYGNPYIAVTSAILALTGIACLARPLLRRAATRQTAEA